MQKAVPVGVGGMAALLGADIDAAREIAAAAAEGEVCVAANDNAPGQVVISGHSGAIERAIRLAGERGLKRCVQLPVSAPFHCPLMQPAADVMRDALSKVEMHSPSVPLVANITAEAISDPRTITELLVAQVTGPVRWRESVMYMKAHGIGQMLECGAGSVLAGLVKRIDREISTTSLHMPEDIEKFLHSA